MRNNGNWRPLIAELDLWQSHGASASFWWRDDDAVAHTPQLERLDRLSRQHDAPVSIAVIPLRLEHSLADYVDGRNHFHVMQHGYAHKSHAAQGQKKIEIGGACNDEQIETELRSGFEILSKAFSEHFLPVLVPPWNRIEQRCYPLIENAGLRGVSSMWARKMAYPVPALLQVNTHLDPVNWRGDRGMIDIQFAIDQLALHLYCKRSGHVDADEPTGILTHHLEQTVAVWDFCDRLFEVIGGHSAAQWVDAGELWDQPKAVQKRI